MREGYPSLAHSLDAERIAFDVVGAVSLSLSAHTSKHTNQYARKSLSHSLSTECVSLPNVLFVRVCSPLMYIISKRIM